MRRALALVLLFSATTVLAAEKWWETYNRGVAAVNANRHADAAAALQSAIAGNPTEGTEIKVGTTIIATYLPHFWLGIARFNLGDVDGALREWRISEEQGAVARTPYHGQLKNWMQRGQFEKQRLAEQAASAPRKAADAALQRAVQAQGDALAAGGDRTDQYRDAQRKLQDALTRFRAAGTNVATYESVAKAAEDAARGFAAASEEGKQLKAAAAAAAARATTPPPQPPAPAPEQREIVIPFDEPENVGRASARPPENVDRASARPPENVGRASARPAENAGRPSPRPPETARPAPPRPIETPAQPAPRAPQEVRPEPERAEARPASPLPRVDVTPAYRAFATGDLVAAERLLTKILATTPAAEAYLLRGCVRYTQAMLSRNPDALLRASTEDFKAALARNRALRLDPSVFSPKLVARFEQVRNGG